MAKVEINDDNLRHCRCPVCSVQSESRCVKQKLIDSAGKPQAAKLYCAFGKSDCNDLDYSKECICQTCLVWDKYDLSGLYYCLKGDERDK